MALPRPGLRLPPVRLPSLPGPIGLVAGVAAVALGGAAIGLELERRVISKRLPRTSQDAVEPFFSLRSAGPEVLTPDGVSLHCEVDEPAAAGGEVEEPQGQPPDVLTILFVHGYALNLDCWHFQRRRFRSPDLPSGPVRTVFYDQRSHGRSSRSSADRCRIPQLAEDLFQVLEEVVGPGPVLLVGHSMGGMTIMRLAQERPELFGDRVRGVALFSTAAGDMSDYSPVRALPGRVFSRVAEPLMATLNRVPELVERSRRAGSDLGYVVTRRMAFGSDVPVSYIEFVSEMLAETSLEVVADFYPAFGELDEYAAFATLAGLPVAVVGGIDDLITTIEHTDKMIELLPEAERVRVPACGHLGMIEHHAVFNAVLERLLARVRVGMPPPG